MSELTYPYLRYRAEGGSIVLYRYDSTDPEPNGKMVDINDEVTELALNNTIAFGDEVSEISALTADAKAGVNTYFLEASVNGNFTISSTGGTNTIILDAGLYIQSIEENGTTFTLKLINSNDDVITVTIMDAASYKYQVGEHGAGANYNGGLNSNDFFVNYKGGYGTHDETLLTDGYNILTVDDFTDDDLPINSINEDEVMYTLLLEPAGASLSRGGTILEQNDTFSYQELSDGLVRLAITDSDNFDGFRVRAASNTETVAFNFIPELRVTHTPDNVNDNNTGVYRRHETVAEYIVTGDGKDVINPGSGDDVVFAGRGDDRIELGDNTNDFAYGGADDVVYRINSLGSVAFDGGDKINDFRLGEDRLTLEVFNSELVHLDDYLNSPDFAVTFNYKASGNNVEITGLNFHFRSSSVDRSGGITKSYFAVNFAEELTPTEFLDAVSINDNLNLDVGSRGIIDLSVLPNLFGSNGLRLAAINLESTAVDTSLPNTDFIYFEVPDHHTDVDLSILSLTDGRDIAEYDDNISVVTEIRHTNYFHNGVVHNYNSKADDFDYDADSNRLFINGGRLGHYGENKIEKVDVTVTLSNDGVPDIVQVFEVRIDEAELPPSFHADQELIIIPSVDYSSVAAVLGTITAVDGDNDGDNVVYSLEQAAINGLPNNTLLNDFSIGESSGVVTYTGTGLDESVGTYSLTIQANAGDRTTDEQIDITFNHAPSITLGALTNKSVVETSVDEAGSAKTSEDGALTISDSTESNSEIRLYAVAGDNSDNSLADPTDSGTKEIALNNDTDVLGTYGTFTFSRNADGEVTSWYYTLRDDDDDTNALEKDEKATDTVKVIAYDNGDLVSGVVSQSVDITGTNDTPVFTAPNPNYTVQLISPVATVTNNFSSNAFGSDSDIAGNIALLTDGSKSSLFKPTSVDGRHLTFTFDDQYRGGEVALYNRLNFNSPEEQNYINNSRVEFRLDGVKVGDTYTLDRSDAVGDGGETDNYASPLDYSDAATNNDQDHVLVVTPPESLIFDTVRVTFDGSTQILREIEIFGDLATPTIDENFTGDIQNWSRGISDFDDASFTPEQLFVYEESGEESDRFDLMIDEDNNISLIMVDGHSIDYELERKIKLSVQVDDGDNLSSLLDLEISINDITGSGDVTPPLHETLTDDYMNNAFTRLAASDDNVSKNGETGTRYLFIGDSGNNNIHGSDEGDILIGNGGDDIPLNGGEGEDVIIVQFDSSTGLFLSGSDNITNFNLGEDTLLIADEGGINTLSQFLTLFVGDGHGVRAAFLLSDDAKTVEGIQLRAVNDDGDNRVNIEFSGSDQFSSTESGIRTALGIVSGADFSDYYDTGTGHLQDRAFTVEHFQKLLSDRGGSDSNNNGLLITDIDNLPDDFYIDAENSAPVLSVEGIADERLNLLRILGNYTITSTFEPDDVWHSDTTVAYNIGNLVDAYKEIDPSDLEYFLTNNAKDDSVTFIFPDTVYGGEFALYNNTIENGISENILGSKVEFIRYDDNDQEIVTYSHTIHSADQIDDYDTPFTGDNSDNEDQDSVIIVTPDAEDRFDAVRVTFDHDGSQFLREFEIYGYFEGKMFGFIDESTTGRVEGIKFEVSDDDDTTSASDFTVYEADGSESARFGIEKSGNHFNLVVNDGYSLDHEFERIIELNVQTYDGVDLSNSIDIIVETLNVTGSGDTNNPLPTDGFHSGDYRLETAESSHNFYDVVTEDDNYASNIRYLVKGNSDDNRFRGGEEYNILVGGDGVDTIDGNNHATDVFVIEYNSLTNTLESGGDSLRDFDIGEDTILFADSAEVQSLTSLPDFIDLCVENGYGIHVSLIAEDTSGDKVRDSIIGVNFRMQRDGTNGDTLHIRFRASDRYDNTIEDISEALGIPDEAEFSDYIDFDTDMHEDNDDDTDDEEVYHRLQDAAFSVDYFQTLLGDEGLYISDFDLISTHITEAIA